MYNITIVITRCMYKLLLYYKLNYSLFFDIRNDNDVRNNIINFKRSIANLKRYYKIVNFF